MKRSNLRNKYLKSSREEDSQRFGKQTNLCVSLLRNTKRSYSNLNEERVMRKLWELWENNEKSIPNDKNIAKVLNRFFSNVIKILNVPEKRHTDSIIENVRDPTLEAMLKYRKHPSILAIKKRLKVVLYLLLIILRRRRLLNK